MAAKKMHTECINTVKPVRDTLDVISGKWKLPIIISIGVGNERFTDIQESIPGISPKILAKELKELEQNQLIKRTVVDDYPIKISYTHEPYANTLTPIIYAMKDWGIKHRRKIIANKQTVEKQIKS
ncbi:MAG: winged helix-turn-helix transcriptional regulator [Sphingobacterium sp.]|uniref:winged helix-turn-helix transcriptional regulator n=1 Tax=Sphingobacterium sp. JB170 TaxID=1434842 RepID=UPI00097ED29A|nr:helix-turn-helix domain-containing protein [Sphingobacterium sp. JB170]SJN49528.1 Transcriptional regulator, HxlR family [Sphingobacterium sp. JB170]